MDKARKGEVWQTDMGIAGKIRPCLLLTDYPAAASKRLGRNSARTRSPRAFK